MNRVELYLCMWVYVKWELDIHACFSGLDLPRSCEALGILIIIVDRCVYGRYYGRRVHIRALFSILTEVAKCSFLTWAFKPLHESPTHSLPTLYFLSLLDTSEIASKQRLFTKMQFKRESALIPTTHITPHLTQCESYLTSH